MKPMLAATFEATADYRKLKYPLLCSPKVDGVRALVINGVLLSRSLKPIPNKFTQAAFGRPEFNGLDGELIIGKPMGEGVYHRTVSGVMAHAGEPEVSFYVFDRHDVPQAAFKTRYAAVEQNAKTTDAPIVALEHEWIVTPEMLDVYEELCVSTGYEGIMMRDPEGVYKFGRSTLREGGLMKLKRFSDSEARVVGYNPWMTNTNPSERNELGYLEKSSKKAGKVAAEKLGNLVVQDLTTNVEFEVGTGFTEAERVQLWKERSSLLGQIITYKYLRVGMVDRPRHPVFLRFREDAAL